MSDFMAKMHQIRFRLGLRPRPRWGAYSAHPDLLAGFKGPTSKGSGGEGRERKGRGGEALGRGGERRTCLPPRFDNPGYGPDQHYRELSHVQDWAEMNNLKQNCQ